MAEIYIYSNTKNELHVQSHGSNDVTNMCGSSCEKNYERE